MKAVYEALENSKANLKVTIESEEWQVACDKGYKKLLKNLDVPGFRKGKVPGGIAKKMISNEAIYNEALNALLNDAYVFGINETNARVVAQPQVTDVTTPTSEGTTITFDLTVWPTVVLGDYKSVEYKVEPVEVTEEDVEARTNSFLNKYANEVVKEEGTVEVGDIAVIDFEGFVDGVAFDGGKGTEYPLTIGSGAFIPGFEEQVVGMATDEEKDINVTFPTEYTPELAGKDATFKVKVCAIKVKENPVVDADLIKDAELPETVTDLETLKAYFAEEVKGTKEKAAEDAAENTFLENLVATATMDIPAVMIDGEVEDDINRYQQQLSSQGIPFETYLQIMGQTVEQLKEQFRPSSEQRVKIRLTLAAIAKDMGVVATEEDIEAELQSLADQYSMKLEEVKRVVPTEAIADDIQNSKVLALLKGTETK